MTTRALMLLALWAGVLAFFVSGDAFAAKAKAKPAVKGAAKAGAKGATGVADYSVSTDVLRLERELEQRLEQKLRVWSGPESLITVTVKLTVVEEAAEAPAAAEDNSVGYFPLTMDMEAQQQTAKLSTSRIKSATVNVLSNGVFEGKAEAALKALVQFLMKPIPATTEITIIPAKIPPPVKAVEPPKEKEKEKEDKKVTPNSEPHAPEAPQWLISLIFAAAAFAVGTLMMLGLSMLGKSIKIGAGLLAEGIKAGGGGGKGGEDNAAIDVTPQKQALAAPAAHHDSGHAEQSREDFPRNMQIFKTLLQDELHTMMDILGESPSDLHGIAGLLPSMDEKEQAIIRGALMSKGVNLESGHVDGGQSPEAWLDAMIKKLLLRKLLKVSSVRVAIGDETFKKLAGGNLESYLNHARKAQTPSFWRISAELLPKSKLVELLSSADIATWTSLLQASEVKGEELQQAATQLLEKQPGEDVGPKTNAYLDQVLLGPAVQAIQKQPFAKADELMDLFQKTNPEFFARLRREVWTPKILPEIPKSEIEREVKPMPVEQKGALVAGFPEAFSEIILAAIPDAGVKKIVKDTAAKMNKNPSIEQKEKNQAICYAFLNSLRGRYLKGKFVLGEAAAAAEAPAAEAPKKKAA